MNLLPHLTDDERGRGVITAFTGNHGQPIAYAGRLLGVSVTIVVAEGANPGKVEAMRNLGADVVFHGRDFDESREHGEKLVCEEGHRCVHAAMEPLLIPGVGTYALAILRYWGKFQTPTLSSRRWAAALPPRHAASSPKPPGRSSRSWACRRSRRRPPINHGGRAD